MSSVGDLCTCAQCGQLIGYYQKDTFGNVKPPFNAIESSWKYFCTKRCKEQYKERKSSKSSSGSEQTTSESSGDSVIGSVIGAIFTEKEKSAEQIHAEAEERRLKEQADKEELELDRVKGQELKAQGKKWLGLWQSAGKTGRMAIGAVTVFALIGVFSVKGGFAIILGIVGLVGLIFFGLVLKDNLKK